jgi:hypothetical protein
MVRFCRSTKLVEVLTCEARSGFVLHAQVSRTPNILKADDGIAYVRRGAASYLINTADQLRRLEYAKGMVSFEHELVNVPKAEITDSPITKKFLDYVVPSAKTEAWLTKQRLIRDDRPTVSGLLLFSEEPQAAMPKRCGVKLYRYKTKEAEGFRDVLAGDPKTIEGCLYEQIRSAVATTVEITESIPPMGFGGWNKYNILKRRFTKLSRTPLSIETIALQMMYTFESLTIGLKAKALEDSPHMLRSKGFWTSVRAQWSNCSPSQ